MGIGKSPYPKEQPLERNIRMMAVADAKCIIHAMTKKLDEMPTQDRSFGKDARKVRAAMDLYREEKKLDPGNVEKAVKATPWGMLDAQITGGDLEEKYKLNLKRWRPPSSLKSDDGPGNTTITWDNIEKRIQGAEESLGYKLENQFNELKKNHDERMTGYEKLEKTVEKQGNDLSGLDTRVKDATKDLETLGGNVASLQGLTAQFEAQRRQIARIEVRTNLTRLTPEQTKTAIDEFISRDDRAAASLRVVYIQHNEQRREVTHLRGWTVRPTLDRALEAHHPNGCTLHELHNFLTDWRIPVQDPAKLNNAVFAALDIAEPAQQT